MITGFRDDGSHVSDGWGDESNAPSMPERPIEVVAEDEDMGDLDVQRYVSPDCHGEEEAELYACAECRKMTPRPFLCLNCRVRNLS